MTEKKDYECMLFIELKDVDKVEGNAKCIELLELLDTVDGVSGDSYLFDSGGTYVS